MGRPRIYIFDLDGTLYRGEEPISFAVETVSKLKHAGSVIRYLTNNSGHTREFFLAKLMRMGFPAELEEIYTSGLGAAKYLDEQQLRSVFVVGEPGLVQTLREEGITVVNSGSDGIAIPSGEESDSVLVGICRNFSYDLMNGAMQRVRSGQPFVATNSDTTYPMEGRRLVPGAGSIVAAIRACSEQEPHIVGKPNPFLISLILEEARFRPEDAMVVGDRIDTDIVSGQLAGCPTHLVLTGVTSTPPDNQSFSMDLTGLIE